MNCYITCYLLHPITCYLTCCNTRLSLHLHGDSLERWFLGPNKMDYRSIPSAGVQGTIFCCTELDSECQAHSTSHDIASFFKLSASRSVIVASRSSSSSASAESTSKLRELTQILQVRSPRLPTWIHKGQEYILVFGHGYEHNSCISS